MKNTLLILVTVLFVFSSCGPADQCGPFDDEGYTWEKKDHVFIVPFYPDSLGKDSISIDLFYLAEDVRPQIVYSSVLDSFRITVDVRGSYFGEPGTDSIWKPRFRYWWEYKNLYLDYTFNRYTTFMQPSQTPQCTPPKDYVDVQKIKVEVPRTLKYVKIL